MSTAISDQLEDRGAYAAAHARCRRKEESHKELAHNAYLREMKEWSFARLDETFFFKPEGHPIADRIRMLRRRRYYHNRMAKEAAAQAKAIERAMGL